MIQNSRTQLIIQHAKGNYPTPAHLEKTDGQPLTNAIR